MKNKNQIFLFLAILFAGAGFLAAASNYTVTAEGVTLQTPVPFSPSSSIGLDAYSCLYPAGAKLGSEEFEITFVFFSTQMQSDTGFSDREMLDYARSTFLGLGMPAKENKTRMFAGKEVKGDVDATSIPHPAICESYLLSLADGRKLVLAFKASASMDKALAETIIAAAIASFAEKK
ncbi:MAG TPA: hypothetical protein VMZ49_11725 [Patescibacteria group bacterium]|nr:hypothetical protein [Patescibacteria group bacterium]